MLSENDDTLNGRIHLDFYGGSSAFVALLVVALAPILSQAVLTVPLLI